MATRRRPKERRRLLPGAVESGLKRIMFRQLRSRHRHRRLRGLGEPRHLVGARPELQQRHAGGAPQCARPLGRCGRRPRHPVPWALPRSSCSCRSRPGAGISCSARCRSAGGCDFSPGPLAVMLLAAALSALPQPKSWPLPNGLGGILGDFFMAGAHVIGPFLPAAAVSFVAGLRLLRRSAPCCCCSPAAPARPG